MVIFRRGNRLLSVASLVLLLEAVAHTMGVVSPLPDDPEVQSVVQAMKGLRIPMGLGMAPSLWGISRGLMFTMTVALVTMGLFGLGATLAAPGERRVHRTAAWILFVANVAMLGIWWTYQVLPPFLFQAAVTVILLLAVALPAPRVAGTG